MLVMALTVTLAGCTHFPWMGQSAKQAETAIEELPPVSDATVEIEYGAYSGFARTSYVTLTVELAEGYEVANAEDVLRWGLTTIWSISDEKPTTSVALLLVHEDGSLVDWDWETAAANLGFDTETSQFFHSFRSNDGNLTFLVRELPVVVGETWPGDVPEFPEEAFVEG